jgi:hypothetical protein
VGQKDENRLSGKGISIAVEREMNLGFIDICHRYRLKS